MGAALYRLVRRERGGPLAGTAAAEVLACSPLRIGDAVQMEPALRALRAAWPEARLTLALRPLVATIGDAFEAAGRVIAYRGGKELREGMGVKPDVGVSFGIRFGAAWSLRRTGARRTVGYDDAGRGMLLSDPVAVPPWVNRPVWEYADHTPWPQARFWLNLLERAGLPQAMTDGVDPVPRLKVQPAWEEAVAGLLRGHGVEDGEPLLVFHAGAEASYRYCAARWGETLQAVHAAQPEMRIVLGGAESDRATNAEVCAAAAGVPVLDLSGQTPLPTYLALLSGAAAVATVDTSASHLAAAVGTSVVVLFGAGDPRIWAPAGAGHSVLHGVNPDCYGCKRPACFQPRHYCMEAIAADEVASAVSAALVQ
jgi:ADP-heptose:LPS heptosyltransferase